MVCKDMLIFANKQYWILRLYHLLLNYMFSFTQNTYFICRIISKINFVFQNYNLLIKAYFAFISISISFFFKIYTNNTVYLHANIYIFLLTCTSIYMYQFLIRQINKWFINIIIVCKRNNMYVHLEVPHSTD